MATLQDMIRHKLINAGDSITFTFKGNVFGASILNGGFIGKCTIKRVHDTDAEDILKQTVAFSSLTAWTEACLQDIMEEYYTRYSSWKRVIHSESKRSMGDLRDQCKLLDPLKSKDHTNELYREIIRLHETIDEMNAYIEDLYQGKSLPPRKWSYMNFKPQQQVEERSVVHEVIDMGLHNTTQDMIMNNEFDEYLQPQ